MCGITGFVNMHRGTPAANRAQALQKATDSMVKRGPDAGNTKLFDNAGFGHRRLSIIDTSHGADQPMFDSTGRYAIVFNGEIFNYKSLRNQLIQNGCAFNTQSDTEVILNLYATEGTGFVNKLNGFFAFAIYDTLTETTFMARDRYGVKPILYAQQDDTFFFASEMKALMQLIPRRTIDTASLLLYLQLHYIPAPGSILNEVKKFPAGHTLFIDKDKLTWQAYYTIPYTPGHYTSMSYDTAQKKLVDLMDAAVERRLIADVPLGAFLSGGLDSSAIVALATRHTPHLNTFSIGYKNEPFFDETYYANLVAKHCGTEHTVFSLTNDDLYTYLQDALDYIDEPFADSSALPVYILSHYTRQHVTVSLSGDGGDELFGGYMKHVADYKARHPGTKEHIVRALKPVWDMMPKSRASKWGNRFRQLDKFAEIAGMHNAERYWRMCILKNETAAAGMLSLQIDTAIAHQRRNAYLANVTPGGDINDVLYTDMQLVLQNDMLTKVDLMSMANSLEVRTPFLDYTVVDFAFSLPETYKVNGSERKRIVHDAFRHLLPAELYNRPKRGFEVPLLKWMRNELHEKIDTHWLNDDFIRAQNIFNPAAVKQLKQTLYSTNPGDAAAYIWTLIVFQNWWMKYMQ